MMILNHPKSLDRFQPDENQPVVYLLKIPTVVDRVKYRHAVSLEGGKQWSQLQLLGVMEDGIRRILSQPEDKELLDKYVAEIEAYRNNISSIAEEYKGGGFSDQENMEEDKVEFLKQLIDRMNPSIIIREIERVVTDHYEPFAAMVADREVYHEVAGLVAARMFLMGWEGINAKFKRTSMGVPDEVLGSIPIVHLIAIGARVQSLMQPADNKLKNSQSRSGGRGDPDRSNGTETPHQTDPSQTTTGAAPSSELANSESIH